MFVFFSLWHFFVCLGPVSGLPNASGQMGICTSIVFCYKFTLAASIFTQNFISYYETVKAAFAHLKIALSISVQNANFKPGHQSVGEFGETCPNTIVFNTKLHFNVHLIHFIRVLFAFAFPTNFITRIFPLLLIVSSVSLCSLAPAAQALFVVLVGRIGSICRFGNDRCF